MSKKIALVYDWFDTWGGVERVLLTLHEMFPEATFYTSFFDKKKAAWAKHLSIKTSFMQKLPAAIRHNRTLSLLFFPYAFESFDFSQYDVVISITSSFGKYIITKPHTKHICYLLTPTRFLWGQTDAYLSSTKQKLLAPFLGKLKQEDIIAAQRPDEIVSISQTVARRCREFYKRESIVIYPPFDEQYWQACAKKIVHVQQEEESEYFLVVSRLEPYKRVDIVIDAFNKLPDKKLIIVGKGTLLNTLQAKAKKNITFLHDLTDPVLAGLYARAQALIMPQEEDFGYVALEAQFFGCPVIAYKKGGAAETIIAGKTGLFLEKQQPEALLQALAEFDKIAYNLKQQTKTIGLEKVREFSQKKFQEHILNLL